VLSEFDEMRDFLVKEIKLGNFNPQPHFVLELPSQPVDCHSSPKWFPYHNPNAFESTILFRQMIAEGPY